MTNPQDKPKRAVEKLPEPARSLGRDTAGRTPEARDGETSGEQAAEQMDEWVASRVPGAKEVPQSEKKPG